MASTLRDMPRQVYRLERARDGNGPYVDNADHIVGAHLLNKHSGCVDHPAPPIGAFRWKEDGARMSPSEQRQTVCGFLTLKDLLDWFDKEDREILKNSGYEEYVVRRLEVPGLLWMDDKGQCVFNKAEARPLEKMTLAQAEMKKMV